MNKKATKNTVSKHICETPKVGIETLFTGAIFSPNPKPDYNFQLIRFEQSNAKRNMPLSLLSPQRGKYGSKV